MKLGTVLICCLGVDTPVPGAARVREKSIRPRSFLNRSSGSFESKGIGVFSPGFSLRSPKVWSRNWPQTQPHCETSFSEKRFCPRSLKMRLLMYRAEGSAYIFLIPSA
jgi:hypothetical protein